MCAWRKERTADGQSGMTERLHTFLVDSKCLVFKGDPFVLVREMKLLNYYLCVINCNHARKI